MEDGLLGTVVVGGCTGAEDVSLSSMVMLGVTKGVGLVTGEEEGREEVDGVGVAVVELDGVGVAVGKVMLRVMEGDNVEELKNRVAVGTAVSVITGTDVIMKKSIVDGFPMSTELAFKSVDIIGASDDTLNCKDEELFTSETIEGEGEDVCSWTRLGKVNNSIVVRKSFSRCNEDWLSSWS